MNFKEEYPEMITISSREYFDLQKKEFEAESLKKDLEHAYEFARSCATLGGISLAILSLCFGSLKDNVIYFPLFLFFLIWIIIFSHIGKILVLSIADLLLRIIPSQTKKLAYNTLFLSIVTSILVFLYIIFV